MTWFCWWNWWKSEITLLFVERSVEFIAKMVFYNIYSKRVGELFEFGLKENLNYFHELEYCSKTYRVLMPLYSLIPVSIFHAWKRRNCRELVLTGLFKYFEPTHPPLDWVRGGGGNAELVVVVHWATCMHPILCRIRLTESINNFRILSVHCPIQLCQLSLEISRLKPGKHTVWQTDRYSQYL